MGLRLNRPEGILTQRFGENANNSYAKSGLKGHTGEDYVNGWKSPMKAVVSGEVYSTMNIDNADPLKYRAIFQIVDLEEDSYEISYGHIHDCFVKKGDFVKAGQVIATEGNWGDVYVGGKAPTLAQREQGAGSHLHFQVRKCKRVSKKVKGKTYLRDMNGYLKRYDKYYEVVDYKNGFNGCVNPELFYQIDINFAIRLLKMLGILK